MDAGTRLFEKKNGGHIRMNSALKASFIVFSVILAAFGDTLAEEVRKPAISFDELKWDFGSTPHDFKIYHSYSFKNTGDAPLKITKLDPNCDCTTISAKDTIIQPGNASEIKIFFHTRDFYGMTTKRAYVHTNDPDRPIVELDYVANIEYFHKLHTSDPKYLTFLQGQEAKEVKLINQSGDRVEYVIEKEPDSVFTLDKYQGSIRGNTVEPINVRVKDSLAKGTYFSNFTVTYDTKPQLRLTIPVKVVRW
jgi:hypothetical protein